tara:strand:+ start:385 stop:534 length:150 start_codon:yes stop_codon:yes gene_type:complete
VINGIAPDPNIYQTTLALPLLERDANEILFKILSIKAAWNLWLHQIDFI